VVRGPLPDQAAVNGLLARLASSGIQVMGLRRQKWPSSTSHRASLDG